MAAPADMAPDVPDDQPCTAPDDDAALLVSFLRSHDAPCPACGYNLRGLEWRGLDTTPTPTSTPPPTPTPTPTGPICPECRQALVLTVGLARPRFGWLLVAMAPGMFSGAAGLLLGGLIVLVAVTEGDLAPWPAFLLAGFGLASGLTATLLAAHRHRLLAQPTTQTKLAVLIWTLHILAFLIAVIWVNW